MTKPKKKTVVSTKKKASPVKKSSSTRSKYLQNSKDSSVPLLFNKGNYMWMGIGAVVLAFGLLLMAGGGMEDPNVWDESVIYSFRRITLAPIVMLTGLVIEIYAIFKK